MRASSRSKRAEPAPEMLTTRRSARTGAGATKSPAPEIVTRLRSRACTSIRTRFGSQNRQAPPWSMRRLPLRTSSTIARCTSSSPRMKTWSLGPWVKRTSAEPEISTASKLPGV